MEVEWLKEGYFVKLSSEKEKFYKITGTEPFEFETGDESTAIFSSVSHGSDSGYKNIKQLEPDDSPKHLFQVLMGVKDGCKYYVKIPTGIDRLGIDEDLDIGYITNEKSPYFDPNPMYQFWLVHDFYPAINASNDTGGSLTPKIWFSGMKYDLELVTDVSILGKLKTGIIAHKPISLGGVKND